MGLGTRYLVPGPQELFGCPKCDDEADFATVMWGIWMPGFMQFSTGVYLFAGLALFGTFKTPALYMATLAFTARRGGLPAVALSLAAAVLKAADGMLALALIRPLGRAIPRRWLLRAASLASAMLACYGAVQVAAER